MGGASMNALMKQLDAELETSMLLPFSEDVDHRKTLIIETLNKHGIDGERFSTLYLEDYYSFYQSFCKYRVQPNEDLQEMQRIFKNCELSAVVIAPFFMNRDLFDAPQTLQNNTLQALIIRAYNKVYDMKLSIDPTPSSQDFIALVNAMHHFDSEFKWILLNILLDPAPYYIKFSSLIKLNIPAFYKACKEHMPFIEQGLNTYHSHKSDVYVHEQHSTLHPMIIDPISIIDIDNHVYCGIYFHKLLEFTNCNAIDGEQLSLILKALADKSRLEILKLLKDGPSYNLEIAQKLSLSTATVSHHTTALVLRNLLTLEKKGGYTYYHVNKKSIELLLQQIEAYLI